MNTKVYESAVLINAALEDDQIENILSRIKETISNNGGTIKEIENWGRKRLAYMVKKSKIGYYAIFRFESTPSLIPVLERFYKLDENILRYLTLSLSKEALEQIEKDKEKAQASVDEIEEVAPIPLVEEEEEEKSKEEISENENNQ